MRPYRSKSNSKYGSDKSPKFFVFPLEASSPVSTDQCNRCDELVNLLRPNFWHNLSISLSNSLTLMRPGGVCPLGKLNLCPLVPTHEEEGKLAFVKKTPKT